MYIVDVDLSDDRTIPNQCGPASCQTSLSGGLAARWCERELFMEQDKTAQNENTNTKEIQSQLQNNNDQHQGVA